MSIFLNSKRKIPNRCFLAVFLVLIAQAPNLKGQSGRRSVKPQPESTPAPQPVSPESAPAKQTTTPAPPGSLLNTVRLLIGRQSTPRHLQSEDVIFASFVNRLNEFANVSASSAGEMKRQDAVIQAKSMNDSFMVLLKFDIDSFQNGTIILNSPDLQIEYQIIAPKSGKKMSHGKVYFQSIGGGRMRKSEWPGGTPIRITAEAAGIEAAEHVHDWLRLEEARAQKPEQ